jgi:hypothetical protein
MQTAQNYFAMNQQNANMNQIVENQHLYESAKPHYYESATVLG